MSEVNKQKIYSHRWYENHKQQLKQFMTCDVCGKRCKIYSFDKHKRTQIHNNAVFLQAQIDELENKFKKISL